MVVSFDYNFQNLYFFLFLMCWLGQLLFFHNLNNKEKQNELLYLQLNDSIMQIWLKAKTYLLSYYVKVQVGKQTVALLKQDKDYMNRQLQELRGRCSLAEERLEQTSKQLEETKQAREELYEKYVSVREQYKSEYEVRLKSELDDIKGKTSMELDKIRSDTKDMFERENRQV